MLKSGSKLKSFRKPCQKVVTPPILSSSDGTTCLTYHVVSIRLTCYFVSVKPTIVIRLNSGVRISLLQNSSFSWMRKTLIGVLDNVLLIYDKLAVMARITSRFTAFTVSWYWIYVYPTKKRLKQNEPEPLEEPTRPNQVWSFDFMHDQLADGRKYRLLNVIDDYRQ